MKKILIVILSLTAIFRAVANPAYNGKLISKDELNGVKIERYQHEQNLTFNANSETFLYASIKDLQLEENSLTPTANIKYKVTEYIYISYDPEKIQADISDAHCLKLENNIGQIFYVPLSLGYEAENWKILGIANINNSACIRHSYNQESAVWISNGTPVYDIEKKTSTNFDYSKLESGNGYDHYVDIEEAAVDCKTGSVWIKISSPCGSGWVSSKSGHVERGGIVYRFPDNLVYWLLIGQFEA